MKLRILNGNMELKGFTEVDTKQAFVNILDDDVIKPLTRLKVGQEYLVRAGVCADK